MDLVRRDRRSLVGSRALSFTYGLDLPHNRPLLDRLAVGGPGFSITKRYVRGDGSLMWVQNHVTKIGGASGRPLIVATSRETGRPFGTLELDRSYAIARKLCFGLIAGRRAFGADLFWAPAVELLLWLYRAEIEGRSMCVDVLARSTDTASPTTLRWVKVLISKGLVEVEGANALTDASSLRITGACERALEGVLSASSLR